MKPTNFRTLELALAFHEECSQIKAKFYIKNQLERASLSAALNLQEGAARGTRKDQKHFYNMAYASIRECQALTRILKNEQLFEQADRIGAHTFKLLRSR